MHCPNKQKENIEVGGFTHIPKYSYSVFIPMGWAACINDYYLNLFFLDDNRVLALAIGTKFADDETQILRTGFPAGDITDGGTVQFIGKPFAR